MYISNTGNTKKDNFINGIMPYVLTAKKQHLDNKILPSVIIAQAALESGWNLEAKTLFGIKGDGVSLVTTEYIDGIKKIVTDSFVIYKDIAEAIEGYFNLLSTERYTNVRTSDNYIGQSLELYACSYATDPNYSVKLVNIIETNKLYKVDDYYFNEFLSSDNNTSTTVDHNALADRIEAGDFGNGRDTRIAAFIAEGYTEEDYNIAQDIVNNRNANNVDYSALADRIEAGDFGNGRDTRIAAFIAEGYTEEDYNIAQDIVNERS